MGYLAHMPMATKSWQRLLCQQHRCGPNDGEGGDIEKDEPANLTPDAASRLGKDEALVQEISRSHPDDVRQHQRNTKISIPSERDPTPPVYDRGSTTGEQEQAELSREKQLQSLSYAVSADALVNH